MLTHSPEETRAAGQTFARELRPGDIVLLEGPLGSGKTTFVQGIAEGLGASESATSPSFVIVKEYALGNSEQGAGNSTTVHSALPTAQALRHIDLYRLDLPRAVLRGDSAADLERIGLAELLADPAAITVIEWADRMPAEALPVRRSFNEGGAKAGRLLRVHFTHGKKPTERVIETG